MKIHRTLPQFVFDELIKDQKHLKKICLRLSKGDKKVRAKSLPAIIKSMEEK
jgi:hypothetical protein